MKWLLTYKKGTIHLYPLSDNAIRIKFVNDNVESKPELIFTENINTAKYKVYDKKDVIELSLSLLTVSVNKKTASISIIISNKGYGLLWHNYGLTDFNPSDEK